MPVCVKSWGHGALFYVGRVISKPPTPRPGDNSQQLEISEKRSQRGTPCRCRFLAFCLRHSRDSLSDVQLYCPMPFSAYSELPALSASVSDAEECPGLSRVPAVATAVTFFLSVAFLPDEGQPGSLEEANCFQNGKSCPPRSSWPEA